MEKCNYCCGIGKIVNWKEVARNEETVTVVPEIKTCPNCRGSGFGKSEAAQPKWISVAERLPDVVAESNWDKRTEYVLAIEANGSFHVGRFYIFKFDGNYEFVSGYERPDVTHWMPLPSTEGIE